MATVQDCFSYPKEVLEKKEEVSKGLKSLYARCVSDETTALQATFDSIKAETKEKEDDKEADEKETQDAEAKKKEEEEKAKKEETKDSLPVIDVDAIVAKVTDSVTASIAAKIDDAVKKQLGLEVEKKETTDSVLPSFSSQEQDPSFLLKGIFQ